MNDLISRQAAIEVLHFWEKNYIWDEDCLNEDAKDIVVSPSKMIEKLPSAQIKQSAVIPRPKSLGFETVGGFMKHERKQNI